VLTDHDFHPDEDTVRLFFTPPSGVLRLDDEVVVTEVMYDEVVLRHYAFSKHWFKVNVTTDEHGRLIETGDEAQQFSFNCDISTPMERDGLSVFGVDLFIDLLIRRDASSYLVGDEDEFEEIVERGLISKAEASAARGGLTELLAMVEARRLIPWLNEFVPFGPTSSPAAPSMERGPIPSRMQPGLRATW
jgi:predicted RNA-binding protein associated with RNAse of E/G family